MLTAVSVPPAPATGRSRTAARPLRVAIVHEWFTTCFAGSERVVEQMLRVFPQADLFGLVDFLPPEERDFIRSKPVTTSFLQNFPFARTRFRQFLPLMPWAVAQLDVSSYDLVLSSSHCVSKGVSTQPDQVHVSMCYTPARYLWDLQDQYLRDAGLGGGLGNILARRVMNALRRWDLRASAGVDDFIAISEFVSGRIRKSYGRESSVLYPPVEVDQFRHDVPKEDFFVTLSRLVPYKRVDLMVDAFSRLPDKKLVIIGGGPCLEPLRAKAPPNVRLLGIQPFDVVRDHLERARGFLFAAEEDFGIAVVEAQAAGTPVIAFGKGGATETVIAGETGIFFDRQDSRSLIDGIGRFESHGSFSPQRCRRNAERFSSERFRKEFRILVDAALARKASGGSGGRVPAARDEPDSA